MNTRLRRLHQTSDSIFLESDEETRLDAFLDRSDGFRESFEQPWATTPAIQRTRVSLASHRLCFVAPSVHLPNCRCHCSTKLSADFVGRIPALQRAIVPVGRPLAIAYPYLLPLASHEATPQHREALSCLCHWEPGAGGREKTKRPAKSLCVDRVPMGWGEKEK